MNQGYFQPQPKSVQPPVFPNLWIVPQKCQELVINPHQSPLPDTFYMDSAQNHSYGDITSYTNKSALYVLPQHPSACLYNGMYTHFSHLFSHPTWFTSKTLEGINYTMQRS